MNEIFDAAKLREEVVKLEKDFSKLTGFRIEQIRKRGGDKAANEVLLSVCALNASRAITVLHIWTGESINSIAERFAESMHSDIKVTIGKFMTELTKKERDNHE